MAGVEWHVILKVIHVLFHFFKMSESRQNEILNQTRQTWLDWKQLLKAVNLQIHFFLNILFFLGDDKVLGYFWCAVITSTNEIIQQKRFNFTFVVGENPWHELGKVLKYRWERPIKTKKKTVGGQTVTLIATRCHWLERLEIYKQATGPFG